MGEEGQNRREGRAYDDVRVPVICLRVVICCHVRESGIAGLFVDGISCLGREKEHVDMTYIVGDLLEADEGDWLDRNNTLAEFFKWNGRRVVCLEWNAGNYTGGADPLSIFLFSPNGHSSSLDFDC